MGDGWVRRVVTHTLRVGQEVSIKKQYGLVSVRGVVGTNTIKHEATVPIGVSERGNSTYSGSMLEK
eukprot:12912394-Prorocentrum_lima.AAC.1